MASTGTTIKNIDYNAIADRLNKNIFGTGFANNGYGGNTTNAPFRDLTFVATGSQVDNIEWIRLRRVLADTAAYLNITLPVPLPSESMIEDGDIAKCYDAFCSDANLNILEANKNNIPESKYTSVLLPDGTGSSVRTSQWRENINHELEIQFSSPDEARYFFNTGGGFGFTASRSGGTNTSQNAAWTQYLSSNAGFFFLKQHYYSLTTTFITLYVATPPSSTNPYINGVNWTISARRIDNPGPNGANGSRLLIRSSFRDNNYIFPDVVDGVFRNNVVEKRSTTIFSRQNPTYRNTTHLSDAEITTLPPPQPPEVIFVATLVIGANTTNYNLETYMRAAGWDGISKYDITLNVLSGVYVGSSSIDIPSINAVILTGNTAYSKLTINNYGYVLGKGGNGGNAGYNPATTGLPGQSGGTAIRTNIATTVINNYGVIAGGGGGGGGGGANSGKTWAAGGAGGGAAGFSPGSRGINPLFGNQVSGGTPASDGSLWTPGAGGQGQRQNHSNGTGGNGGYGGNLGQAGLPATQGNGAGPPGAGGAAGIAIRATGVNLSIPVGNNSNGIRGPITG